LTQPLAQVAFEKDDLPPVRAVDLHHRSGDDDAVGMRRQAPDHLGLDTGLFAHVQLVAGRHVDHPVAQRRIRRTGPGRSRNQHDR
jgi:hypothetical protein